MPAVPVFPRRARLALLGAFLLAAGGPGVAATAGGEPEGGAPPLAERHRRFLEEAAPLLDAKEREVFLAFREDYQRDGFVDAFWKVRDPYPETPRNELREQWSERVAKAREELGGLDKPRARYLLAFGEPTRKRPAGCFDLLLSLEVWAYDHGSDRVRGDFTLVFLGRQGSPGERLWQPLEGLSALFLPGAAAGASDAQRLALIAESCPRGDDLLSDLARSLDVAKVERAGGLFPHPPSDEWALALAARSTDLPPGAAPLPAEVRIAFPGRNQSRTVVQGRIEVPRSALGLTEVGSRRSYDLLLDGEVLRQGELFERFRYRFDFPLDLLPPGDGLPLVVERSLRPGPYTLLLKVEDASSDRAFRRELAVEVPPIAPGETSAVVFCFDGEGHGTPCPYEDPCEGQGTPCPYEDPCEGHGTPCPYEAGAMVAQPAPETAIASSPESATAAAPPAAGPIPASAGWLAEANAAIGTGDHMIRVLALPEVLTTGKLRVEARAEGEGIARVAFLLGGRTVMRKTRPPYTVELDLGSEPRLHELRVEALDAGGSVLASDEVLLNAGPHRFAVRLLEPQPNRAYAESVRALAAVEVPEGERLDRLELYLGEERVATLFQPPFEQPLRLPPGGGPIYLRALAVLEGGLSAEDVVFLNAPDLVEDVRVDLVELYTTVADRRGQLVEGLGKDDFVVEEDGVEQAIVRFEAVRDLPIRAGIVLDTSTSMLEELADVEKAAYRFLETVLTPRDRAAIFTFNDRPQLVVRFTGDTQVLAGGLAGLAAEGETALYDAIVFALHYFSGLGGKRAIVVLTDGEDSRSTYTFDDALAFARRTGVAIYVIGLSLGSTANEVRLKMQRLASETGGGYFSVERAAHLGSTYERIQNELRSQYLIAYQSSQSDGDEGFRKVAVEVRRPGLEARTIRGYYP